LILKQYLGENKMGGDTNYSAPAQPSYAQGLKEALEAQTALLTGKKVGEADFRSVGKLEDLVREYEAPLRKTTAQIDTDVLRQTLLGDMQSYDDQGRRIIGYEKGAAGEVDPAELSAWEAELEKMEDDHRNAKAMIEASEPGSTWTNEGESLARIEEHKANRPQPRGVVDPAELAEWEAESARLKERMDSLSFIDFFDDDDTSYDNAVADWEAHKDTRPQPTGVGSTPIYSDPDESKIGKKYYGGGMVDLVGDTRQVQQAVRSEDYASYVKDNPDILEQFQERRREGDTATIEEYGKQHYEDFGKS
jgi:hypothetical protein